MQKITTIERPENSFFNIKNLDALVKISYKLITDTQCWFYVGESKLEEPCGSWFGNIAVPRRDFPLVSRIYFPTLHKAQLVHKAAWSIKQATSSYYNKQKHFELSFKVTLPQRFSRIDVLFG